MYLIQIPEINVHNQRADFNTGPYGGGPLKIKVLKIGLLDFLRLAKGGRI